MLSSLTRGNPFKFFVNAFVFRVCVFVSSLQLFRSRCVRCLEQYRVTCFYVRANLPITNATPNIAQPVGREHVTTVEPVNSVTKTSRQRCWLLAAVSSMVFGIGVWICENIATDSIHGDDTLHFAIVIIIVGNLTQTIIASASTCVRGRQSQPAMVGLALFRRTKPAGLCVGLSYTL